MDAEAAFRRAKRPRNPLAGPYGHPIHAAVITLPIGTWVASLVFDILAFISDDPGTFALGAAWLIGIGIAGGALAALFGFLDFSQLPEGTHVRHHAVQHMVINLSVLALFVVSLVLRLAAGTETVSVAGFVVSLIALAGLSVSGYIGGDLAYRHGVRVADEDTQREAY